MDTHSKILGSKGQVRFVMFKSSRNYNRPPVHLQLHSTDVTLLIPTLAICAQCRPDRHRRQVWHRADRWRQL